MLIDRTHTRWLVFTLVATLAAAAWYALYRHLSYQDGGNGPSGGSWNGLAFGILGFGLMIFCGLLGIRKKIRVWRLGRAQSWLRAHIWLGLLTVPLIFFHSGLSWGNHLTFWLMILFAAVIVSGIVGLILQNVIPRTMLVRVQAETTFEEIPHVIDLLREEAEQMVTKVCGPLEGATAPAPGTESPMAASHEVKKDGAVQGKVVKSKGKAAGPVEGSGPLKTFFINDIRPFLSQRIPPRAELVTSQGALAQFEHTRALVPEALHDTLKDLESICEERRQIALQLRLHLWLHFWFFIHAPLTYALLVLSVWHAVVSTVKFG